MREKGLALVTVLIFTLVMTILAGAVLSLMTSEARLTEHQIRRIRAYYAVQSGTIDTIERLRKDTTGTSYPKDQTKTYNIAAPASNVAKNDRISIKINPVDNPVAPGDTRQIEATVDYSP